MKTRAAVAWAAKQPLTIEEVDLDGPRFIRQDLPFGVTYEDGMIHCPPGFWGHPG